MDRLVGVTVKRRVEHRLRRFEQRLGIDREGRSVWVWLLPPAIGIIAAVLGAFMPGIPDDTGVGYRLGFAAFALVTMTMMGGLYLIQFDNDHNQQADDDGDGGGGTDEPPAPAPVAPGTGGGRSPRIRAGLPVAAPRHTARRRHKDRVQAGARRGD